MEFVGLVSDYHGVVGIISTLKTHHIVHVSREKVSNFSFTLIPHCVPTMIVTCGILC